MLPYRICIINGVCGYSDELPEKYLRKGKFCVEEEDEPLKGLWYFAWFAEIIVK